MARNRVKIMFFYRLDNRNVLKGDVLQSHGIEDDIIVSELTKEP